MKIKIKAVKNIHRVKPGQTLYVLRGDEAEVELDLAVELAKNKLAEGADDEARTALADPLKAQAEANAKVEEEKMKAKAAEANKTTKTKAKADTKAGQPAK